MRPRLVSTYTLRPELIEQINDFAKKTGRSKSNAVETLLMRALDFTPPPYEEADIALAKGGYTNISRAITFHPVILKRLIYEADFYNRTVSKVTNRFLLDHLEIPYGDLS